MTRSLAAAAVALAVIFTQAGILYAAGDPAEAQSRPGSVETTSAASGASADDAIPDDIPIGTAEDNPETSRAIMQVLKESAARYAQVENFRATGTYIESTKVRREDKTREEQSASRLELLYRRPDRLKIMVTGEEVAAGLVADGTTVTLLWPNQKQYRRIPQPESLAAFAEEERAGEILDDDSNAIVYSVVGALLLSEDPLVWLHANVESYVYDGEEVVRGRPAWRIKFLQSNPAIVVINWVDKETKLLSRVSIIQARDSEGEFIESYSDSTYGRIRLTVFDSFEADGKPIMDEEFTPPLTAEWKERPVEKSSRPSREEQLTGWERLVRAATAVKLEETTPSLTVQTGGPLMKLRQTFESPAKVSALAFVGTTVGEKRTLAAAMDGKIVYFDYDGQEVKQSEISESAQMLTLAHPAGDAPPVLVTARLYGDAVRGYSLAGDQLWSYEQPGGRISSLLAVRPPEATSDTLYVSYMDGTGLRVLNVDGKLQFASRRLTEITALTAGQMPDVGWTVIASTGDSGGLYTPGGKLLSKSPTEEEEDVQVGMIAFDDSNASAPLLQVAGVGDAEYVLRRARPDNSLVWTVPLAQAVDKAEPVGLAVARLRLPSGPAGAVSEAADELRPHAVTLLSDGRITVVSPEGDVQWRGRAVFGGAVASGDTARTAAALLAADLDGNGEDELYIGGEGHVMQVVPGN